MAFPIDQAQKKTGKVEMDIFSKQLKKCKNYFS
jgi:hypothetical protein